MGDKTPVESMGSMIKDLDFLFGKRVLLTGHTGFKGSWMSMLLIGAGAKVAGYSLAKYDNEHLFLSTGLSEKLEDRRGDVTDLKGMSDIFDSCKPEIVIHMAAQPLVRRSYREPVDTFSTNVMGTVNVLECVRKSKDVRACIIVTSDKCYKNRERPEGYCEMDELGGHDPYSASKACAELVSSSYRESLMEGRIVATVRAGNIIGGGDMAEDRLIPDCVRGLLANGKADLRNPGHVRPWQHVLEPLFGYLILVKNMLSEGNDQSRFATAWNFGPERKSFVTVKDVADEFVRVWGRGSVSSTQKCADEVKETELLCLDNSKAKRELGWSPVWGWKEAVRKTAEWYRDLERLGAYRCCTKQIDEYFYGLMRCQER